MNKSELNDKQEEKDAEQFGTYNPWLDLASYCFPTLDLLDAPEYVNLIDEHRLETNKQIIVSTLQMERIDVSMIKATVGPRLTLYEIVPGPGVRVASIRGLQADLSLRLGTAVRVTGPLPGRGTMGIEVPHGSRQFAHLRSVLATEQFLAASLELPVAFGRTKYNDPVILDLAKLPHLLVAGATGQGKSVLLNALLISLLYQKHPAELKLVLVDLNQLELGLFTPIAHHFLAATPDTSDAVITDVTSAIRTLNTLMIELNNRHDLLRDAGVRQFREYNHKFIHRKMSDPERHRYLPYIVVVIDDFAKLMSADNQAELLLSRLAQLGRPVGIHLIIATQRPSSDVITRNIKSNFPVRAAFRFPASADSRTILEMNGAEKLCGDGDMLLLVGPELIPLQGAYISTGEVTKVNEFIGSQKGYPTAFLLPEYFDGSEPPTRAWDPDDCDPFFEEAARLVVVYQQGSTSLIQRKLKLGYNRAGRILDQLEAAGIVGPFEGAKARDVLYTDENTLEAFLQSLKPGSESMPKMQHVVLDIPVNNLTVEVHPVATKQVHPVKKRSLFARIFGRSH